MGQELSSLCNFCHQAVKVAGLHGLIETNDVGVAQPPHELCFTQEVLLHIVLFDLVCLNDFYRHLNKFASVKGSKYTFTLKKSLLLLLLGYVLQLPLEQSFPCLKCIQSGRSDLYTLRALKNLSCSRCFPAKMAREEAFRRWSSPHPTWLLSHGSYSLRALA